MPSNIHHTIKFNFTYVCINSHTFIQAVNDGLIITKNQAAIVRLRMFIVNPTYLMITGLMCWFSIASEYFE